MSFTGIVQYLIFTGIIIGFTSCHKKSKEGEAIPTPQWEKVTALKGFDIHKAQVKGDYLYLFSNVTAYKVNSDLQIVEQTGLLPLSNGYVFPENFGCITTDVFYCRPFHEHGVEYEEDSLGFGFCSLSDFSEKTLTRYTTYNPGFTKGYAMLMNGTANPQNLAINDNNVLAAVVVTYTVPYTTGSDQYELLLFKVDPNNNLSVTFNNKIALPDLPVSTYSFYFSSYKDKFLMVTQKGTYVFDEQQKISTTNSMCPVFTNEDTLFQFDDQSILHYTMDGNNWQIYSNEKNVGVARENSLIATVDKYILDYKFAYLGIYGVPINALNRNTKKVYQVTAKGLPGTKDPRFVMQYKNYVYYVDCKGDFYRIGYNDLFAYAK